MCGLQFSRWLILETSFSAALRPVGPHKAAYSSPPLQSASSWCSRAEFGVAHRNTLGRSPTAKSGELLMDAPGLTRSPKVIFALPQWPLAWRIWGSFMGPSVPFTGNPACMTNERF